MGDVQSTQRGSRQDEGAEEESRGVDNPQTEQNTKHETFRNSEQSSEISRKGEDVRMNGCHEDQNGAQAAPEAQMKEEEAQGEVHDDGVHLEISELDVKQGDINSLGRFFSNIGLKLTINRGSGEKREDDNKETDKEESEKTETEKTEDKTEAEVEQDSSDPTGLILTAVAAGNVLENADERAETSEEPELDAESEQEPHSTNPTGPGDVEIDSPIRRFFATGIFSGLWKKKEAGDETTEKESEEKGDNQVPETAGQTDEEPTSPGELRGEIPEESPEPDNVASPETDRVQMSPLLRFLSGSSLRRLSTKQRNVKSSEARLCDSGEPDPAELLPSEPAEDQRNASAPASAEAGKDEEEEVKEEEGAWASFKRFMSPKPRMKKSLRGAQETEQPASAEEPRAAQTSDHSPEEGKRRKNSSVSWEAVLCGSGRRRSRKTSDSEDEIPPIDLKQRREDGGPKSGEDSGAENGKETTAPKLDGSPQEEDRTSTWKSLKRIVTPKRKSRDEDEAIKTKTQSEGEGGQENPSFSIKNLLPGRKKQRSEESQGRASPDEAEKDRASDDDDSETPGVVPLSEFELDEEENQSVEETEKLELQQDEETDKNLCFPQDLDEGSEKQDTNQEPDDGTELASKHQQLSVISEEGVITEPWATLASALAAAEPAADLTLQDDTEMFTAASQFSSESAKTSGNATPALAERQTVQTETVLLQVAETFSGSPERRESSQEESSSELAGSVSEVAFEELDSTDHTEVEDEEPPSAEDEDVQELVKELAEGLASEGGNNTGEKEIREAGDEMLTFAEVNVGAGDAKQVEEPEKEGPAEGLGPPPQPQVIYGNVGMCLGTETGGEKPERGTCLFTEVILKQEDAKSVEELRDLRAEQVSSSNHQEDNTASPEPLVISENPATAETAKDEADGSAEAPQEPDVLRAVQGLSSDVGEVGILYLETEAASSETSENIGVSDDTVKLQEVTDCTGLTEDSHQLVDASKTVEEPEASQAASSLASGNGDVSSVETEQKADNILQEELVEENKKESIIPKDTPESEEAVTISEEPEAMKAAWSPALGSEEDQGLPPETQIILKADLDTEEDTKATKLMAGDACEEPVDEGRNVRMPVHPAAEESEVPPLVSEKEPVPDEPRRETILSDPKVDPSESDEEAEGPQVLQQSSESAELEITPEIILTEETVPEELKHHSEITLEPEEPSETDGEAAVSQVFQQSLESEKSKEEPSDNISGEETVPGEPRDETTVAGETRSEPVEESKMVEAVEEPTQTVKASHWVSEDSSGSSLEAEETSEKIQRADSDPGEHKVETVPVTEEPEVSQTAQSSSGQSEDTSVPSAELEITPEIILTEETVPDEPKEELKLHSEVTLEPEEPSETDGEAAVSQVLQQSLESEESKEEPSDNISGEETVPGEPRGETSSEPVEESRTVEAVEEPTQTVKASHWVSEDSSGSSPKAEETSEKIQRADSDPGEHKVETVPVTEEPEVSQTAQSSSGQSEDTSVPSAELEITPEIILTEETVPDEPKEELKLHSEVTLEPEEPSETDGEAAVSQVLQQSLESEESKEEPSDNISGEETVPGEPRGETTVAGETRSEPVEESKTVEAVEEVEAVEASAVMSEDNIRSTPTTEGTSENIPTELDTAENQVEPVPVVVEAFEAAEEPEILQTVLLSSLKLEDSSVPSAEPEIPAEIILTEETVVEEAGYETTAAGETIIEPADDSKTADVVEELESVETSSLDREESSISPDEPEETSENTESDKDENKTETLLHNESPTEPEDAVKVLKEPEELEAVLQAERQTLMKEEPAADEPKDVQLVVTEGVFEKVDDYKPLQMSSVDLEESSISSSGPEASSKNVLQTDLHTDQHKTQTTFITEDTSEPLEDPQKAEGAELAPRVQPSSEDTEKIHVCLLEAEEISQSTSQAETVPHETNEENRIDPEDLENVEELESEHPSLVKEAPCGDHALEEKPLSDEPKLETFLSGINLQLVDPSETDGEAAVSQVLQQSLESEESKEEPSDNISGGETVPGEPRGETSSEPVEESRTVEAVEEPTQAVKASYLVSEDSSGSSPKAEETSEKIQRADSDPGEHKVETVPVTEEPEVSQTAQSSSGQSEDTSVPSAELEITPEIILTEEPVPDEAKEELKLHSEVTLEPEEPSETDGEAAVSQVLQQSLESEESKEEPSDNISGEETVPGEPRGETRSEPVEESKTVEAVEEVEAVEASAVMSEDNIRSTPTTEGTSENIPTELDTAENQVEPVPVVVEAFEAAEEPEILQTVLLSSLKLEDNSVPSAEPEIPAEIILTEETAPDEPTEKLKLQTEITLEPEEPSETDGEAEVLNDVHPQPVELEESREQSPEGEVTTSDNISEETTGEPRHETTAAGETGSEPADDSKTDEVVEEPETVETSSLVKDESSISPDEPEETSENILKTESGVDENRVETCLVTEEPPEFSQTVRSSTLESEDTSVPSAEEITSKIVLSEETVPGEPRGETRSEPVEESRTVEAVEEVEAVEASAVMSEDNIRSTPTTEGTSENIPTEPDTAENQVEPVPVVVEAFEAAEEPEILQTVLLSSLKLEDNSVPSAEPEIPAEIILTEETVVEEAGYETTAAGETIIEPADDSKTADVVEELESVETSSLDREESSISPDEPEETSENILKTESGVDENRVETRLVTGEPPEFSQTVRSSTLESEDTSVPSAEEIMSKIVLSEETVPDEPGDETAAVGEAICGQEPDENAKEHESSSPPPEAEETSDTLKAETGSEETKKEITLNPEDTESADGAEAVTAVDPTPESEHLAKEATRAHIPGEEMVPGGHEEEPINDILELTQDPLVPWLESGELEVTSNNVPQAETDTVLLPDVRLKPADVQEPEVLQAVQAASFESVEANDGGQVTPEHTPKAEPEEEDLPVETTTDDPKTEQVEEDKCSGTEREPVEDGDPSALNTDTCQDVSIEEPENLRKQTSETLMDAMQAEEEVKEEVEAARPSVKGGVEKVEGGKAEDTAEEAATSERTTADSVVEVEDKGLSEEEKEQVGDQVEEKERTTVQGEASHSSPVAGAKEEDEWMDAEENIQAETAGSSYEVEEPLGPQRGGEDVEQAGLERGKEAAHASRAEAEGREDTKKADEAGGFESEEEDFDVALEQPGNRSLAAAFLTG